MSTEFSRKVRFARLWIGLPALVAGAQTENTLSQKEASAGYDLLFNGADLDAWHAYRMTAVTDAWKVRTDTPLGPRIQNGAGNKLAILTDKTYRNFDLKVDVHVPPNGTSGIFTRFEEVLASPLIQASGPEFHVCGSSQNDCQAPLHRFGACFDMFPVVDSLRSTWFKPSGEWNQVRIVAFDSHYVHYGNGKKLLEYKIGTPEFFQAYERSKYFVDGNNDRYYDIHPGGILLNHHGEEGIGFRNIKAKELAVHPFFREFPDGKWPDTLPQEFVFGELSAGSPSQGRSAPPVFTSWRGGPGEILIRFTLPPSEVRAYELDGRRVELQVMDARTHAVRRRAGGPDLIALRYTVEGVRNAGIQVLP